MRASYEETLCVWGFVWMSCVFCGIVDGSAPAHVYREDEHCMAIIPRKIEVDGHLLVLTKRHYIGIADIPSDLLSSLMEFVKVICTELERDGQCGGFNILNASGPAAQQSVPHFHVHILPRSHNDGINAWPVLPGGRNIYGKTHNN